MLRNRKEQQHVVVSEFSTSTSSEKAWTFENTKSSIISADPASHAEDTDSLESCSVTGTSSTTTSISGTTTSRWSKRYQPPPVISQSTILLIGVGFFVLATIWPPLLLLVAYVASKLIPYSFRVNDDVCQRRQLYREFSLDDDHPENFKQIPEHIQLEESYWINERGMALCNVIMIPKDQPIQAVVCFCHGYSDNLSYSKKVEYQRLVSEGIAVVGIEYEGHGRSDGPLCLIPNWELLIDDVSSYFTQVTEKRFPGIPVFLMGESMGGAVAYSTYNRSPDHYRGVVFICPMCKISDDMLPPQWVINCLSWLVGPRDSTGSTSFFGSLPIAPSKHDLFDCAHHIPEKAEQIYRCPTSFARNPRLATARELLQMTQRISHSLRDFNAPFLVVHGREDRVTDPNLSLALYSESKSEDKSIRLYDGMWHALTCSEPKENIDRVFKDCTQWILDRTSSSSSISASSR